jgi:hypothetical protein
MLLSIIMFVCFFPFYIHTGEFPQYAVVPDVLEESEMIQLSQLTNSAPELLWYGRYNFWKENFEAEVDAAGQDIIFRHVNEHECATVTDKLSKLFLTKVQELGVEIAKKRIILQSYLDRNIVNSKNAASSGMFWHQDSIIVDGQQKIADFTLILLANGKIQNWSGAKVVLQQGGEYSKTDPSRWVNSDHPKIEITPRYNQAIIFKNSDAAHMVTPLEPLSDENVQRDVFILNCFSQ